MSSIRIFFVLLLFLGISSLFTFCFSKQEATTPLSLDSIPVTPEWMQALVEEVIPAEGMHGWIPTGDFESSSLIKLPRFPRNYTDKELKDNNKLEEFTALPTKTALQLTASVVKNERFSGQFAVISRQPISKLKVITQALSSSNGAKIPSKNINIRFVGYVPIERGASEFIWSAKKEEVEGPNSAGLLNPSIVADPLFELTEVAVPAYRTQPIWISIDVPNNIPDGLYIGQWKIVNEAEEAINLEVKIKVLNIVLPPSSAYEFYLDFWLNPDAIAANYHLTPWSEAHWAMLKKYLKELAALGGKTITTTITHEPWQIPWRNGTMRPQTYTGFGSMVEWRKSKSGQWHFDYSIFDRYVQTAQDCGIRERINAYSLVAFRGKERLHYYDESTREIIDKQFDSPDAAIYQEAWKAFLQDFVRHLTEKKWLELTYLSFDEKPNETMKIISQLIKESAPEFSNRITIAGHPESTTFATGALSISYEFFPNQNLSSAATLPIIQARKEAGKMTTFYLCGQPAHPNTLSFSPAVEARMIPWLALKYQTDGYLRWAYNSWPRAPLQHPTFNFIQGDDYIVYPGKNGPMSSIRQELLKDGIEDFELVRLLQKKVIQTDSLFTKAIELATRNQDGRAKDIQDMIAARKLLTNSQ